MIDSYLIFRNEKFKGSKSSDLSVHQESQTSGRFSQLNSLALQRMCQHSCDPASFQSRLLQLLTLGVRQSETPWATSLLQTRLQAVLVSVSLRDESLQRFPPRTVLCVCQLWLPGRLSTPHSPTLSIGSNYNPPSHTGREEANGDLAVCPLMPISRAQCSGTPVIPVFRKPRQEDCKFEPSLGFIARLHPTPHIPATRTVPGALKCHPSLCRCCH